MYEHGLLKHYTVDFKDRLEEGQAQDYYIVHLTVYQELL
jgi:hypothetical protein